MLNIRYCLLASVAVLLSAPASAMSMNQSTGMLPQTTVNSLNNQQLSAQFLSLKLSNISNFPQTATVCFVTDTEKCTGYEFDNGDGSGGGSGGGFPDYNPDPDKRCEKEGYTKITCNSMEIPTNKCPYDETYIEECVCKPGLIPCNAPSVGIGPACDGKYESCCKDECPSGYATGSGACKQASSLKTACGNACYKILNNTCNMGSLNPPSEGGGYKNKIVYTTECGNPCWQSFNDNCPTGYVKTKAGGKCYETSVSYTPFGSTCYKEISCCTPTCSYNWYLSKPSGTYRSTSSSCPGINCYQPCDDTCLSPWSKALPSVKYLTKTNGCGNNCYMTCNDNCSLPFAKDYSPDLYCYDAKIEYTECKTACYRKITCTGCQKILPQSTGSTKYDATCPGSYYFWNADGKISIPEGINCWEGYGQCATINTSATIVYKRVFISFWNQTYINTTLRVDGELKIGFSTAGKVGTVTFNAPVYLNGTLYKQKGFTVQFLGGISGNYVTKCGMYGGGEVPC